MFRGFSSQDFDLTTCLAFDSDSDETDSFLTREAVASESYRGEFKRIHNFKYTEVFSPQFTLIKNDFSDFTLEEERRVLKWLTGSSNASFISVYYDDSEVISWEALGGFTEISLYKLGNGRTVGIVATFESAMPYALSPIKSVEISGGENKIIDIDTDEPESLIYPRVTIQQTGNQIIQLENKLTREQAENIVIEGMVYKYAGDNQTTTDDEYYWISPKWVGGAVITFSDDSNSTSHPYQTSDVYDSKDEAMQNTEELSVEMLVDLWENVYGYTLDGSTDESSLWDRMQWKEKNEGYIVGNIYEKVEDTEFNPTLEYFMSTPLTGVSSTYKYIDKETNTINNGNNMTVYQKVNVNASSFGVVKNALYVKTTPQVEISMTANTNVLHITNNNPNDKTSTAINTTGVVLTNTHNGKEQKLIIKNNQNDEKIILDGANKVTSSSYPNRILGDDFTWNWLSLVEGENTIGVIGNCTVTLEWREPIKCGEF